MTGTFVAEKSGYTAYCTLKFRGSILGSNALDSLISAHIVAHFSCSSFAAFLSSFSVGSNCRFSSISCTVLLAHFHSFPINDPDSFESSFLLSFFPFDPKDLKSACCRCLQHQMNCHRLLQRMSKYTLYPDLRLPEHT